MLETTENNIHMICRREGAGIAIQEARTDGRDVVVPETLFGLPVKALGPRAFSPRGGEEHRRIRSIVLPAALERVGDYAFYNCTGLERLHLTDRTRDWGGGCLMNCRSLRSIVLRRAVDRSATLFYFANELSTELDVAIAGPEGTELRLIFPEYIESFENNDPAHHFDFHLYGPGFPYHHAFRDKQLDLALYDGAWEEMLRREYEPGCALRLAYFRLRYPGGLGEKGRAAYQAYLSAHCGEALAWLLAERDCRGLSWLLSRFAPSREELSAALALSRERQLPEAVALLLEEQHRRFPAGRGRRFEL